MFKNFEMKRNPPIKISHKIPFKRAHGSALPSLSSGIVILVNKKKKFTDKKESSITLKFAI